MQIFSQEKIHPDRLFNAGVILSRPFSRIAAGHPKFSRTNPGDLKNDLSNSPTPFSSKKRPGSVNSRSSGSWEGWAMVCRNGRIRTETVDKWGRWSQWWQTTFNPDTTPGIHIRHPHGQNIGAFVFFPFHGMGACQVTPIP
jgi:hypothetical protein